MSLRSVVCILLITSVSNCVWPSTVRLVLLISPVVNRYASAVNEDGHPSPGWTH
jgi:hypothetical protein